MNRRPRWWQAAWLAAAAVSIGGCGGESTTGADCTGVERLEVEPRSVVLSPGEQGYVVDARIVDSCGLSVSTAAVDWTSSEPDIVLVEAGALTAASEGRATITARAAGLEASAEVFVFGLPADFTPAVRGLGIQVDAPHTTDLWVHGDLALTGSAVGGACPGEQCTGQPIVVWDLSEPDRPVVVGTIRTPAPRVNDVKISPDGRFAVATKESSDDGIVILDLTTPGLPAVVGTYRGSLERGVHNVWIEIIGGTPYVFAAEDGSSAEGGLHVLDVSALDAPVEVDHYYAGTSSVHDVYVRDGLAFVSHWDAGLVILDAGNGVAGGSPSNVVAVSRVELDGETHNAWYWPAARLVFVGEEDFQAPGEPAGAHGRVHVVDVRDLANPVEIATISPPDGIAPHNFWLDEDRAILYVGWYHRGVVAIDVSAPLSGDLATQGRELAVVRPSGPLGDSSFWAVQLHGGRLYGADIFHGIWVFDPMP